MTEKKFNRHFNLRTMRIAKMPNFWTMEHELRFAWSLAKSHLPSKVLKLQDRIIINN